MGKLHAWTEKNVLEISSSNSSLSIRQRSVIFHSLREKYATLARLKLGFEPIQNRSGLKKRPQKVLSGLSVSILHPIHPSMRPSVRPSVLGGVRSALGPHAEHELACMQKKRKASQRSAGPDRLFSRSKQLSQHQQNHQQRPLQGFTSTRGRPLNQLTLFTKDRTQISSPGLWRS